MASSAQALRKRENPRKENRGEGQRETQHRLHDEQGAKLGVIVRRLNRIGDRIPYLSGHHKEPLRYFVPS